MVAIELYDPARRDGDLECLAEDGLIYGDEFGRDLWARVVGGSRISVMVGFITVAIGASLGLVL
ncbi:hypothetical protein CL616_03535, partial [archaeon]|nr:hypothetical protein [archaeon]